jgi:two-component system, response regulator
MNGITMSSLKRILLVEDSMRDAEMALHGLAEFNLANDVLHVRDGVEALDYLHRRGQFTDHPAGPPALVMLDLKMPRLDGMEVLRQMKGDPELKSIPVVVMTSSREEPDLAQAYALGANAYVVKPVQFHEFVDAVKQVGSFWAVLNEPPPVQLRKRA